MKGLAEVMTKSLKEKQKHIYDQHILELRPIHLAIDSYGFSYSLTLKAAKIGNMINSFKIDKGSLVLDVGCRAGRLLNKLNAQYATIGVGIDIAPKQLRENIKRNPFNNKYCAADAEYVPFKDHSFDYIFCDDVLEHLPNPENCISEISRLTRKNGKILIYPISKNDKYTWHWVLRKISFGKFGVDRGRWGDHERERFVYPVDMLKMCEGNNIKIQRLIYFHSFFTLAFDEVYNFLRYRVGPCIKTIAKRKRMRPNFEIEEEMPKGTEKKILKPPIYVKLWSLFVSSTLCPLELLDKIWTRKGYSNGFFILGRKT